MIRTLAALFALTYLAVGCGHAPDTTDAGSADAAVQDAGLEVVDAGPCSQGLGCGPTPPPSQCTAAEDGGCTNDFGCYCATLSDGTCAWEILPSCETDAGSGTDAGPGHG